MSAAPECGDGLNVGNEICDDGNGNDNKGQGCLNDCTGSHPGYSCGGGTKIKADTCDETCGDGIITMSEGCDDEGTGNDDGCDSLCAVEVGWTLVNGTYNGGNKTISATPYCGDGLNVGNEVCDDGISNNGIGEGCFDNCLGSHPGYTCGSGSNTGPDICTELCGDGFITKNEGCDDGGTGNDDGCSSLCVIEVGWILVTGANGSGQKTISATPDCGDELRVGFETCDDGRTNDGVN